MTMDQLAADGRDHPPRAGIVDLTVNGEDTLQIVSISNNDTVSIGFNTVAGAMNGVAADWYVLCQGPKGWTSWNGTKWVSGTAAWKKHTSAASKISSANDNVQQTVVNVTLPSTALLAGTYTYYVGIVPWPNGKEGKENIVSVPLIVTP